MDATPNEDVPDGLKVQVGIGQKNTVNTSPVGSVNRLSLGFGRGGPIRTGGPLHPMKTLRGDHLFLLQSRMRPKTRPGLPECTGSDSDILQYLLA